MVLVSPMFCFFFFNDTATTEIYTLSLHDALPISPVHDSRLTCESCVRILIGTVTSLIRRRDPTCPRSLRSEEHTSELQSQSNLVCRLLLEKKKTPISPITRPLNHTCSYPLLTASD